VRVDRFTNSIYHYVLRTVFLQNYVVVFHARCNSQTLWLGLLEMDSGISSASDVMAIPPWLAVVKLGSVFISSTPDIMIILPWLYHL
jgi:hypothetical protein